jgi:hypothetical protein
MQALRVVFGIIAGMIFSLAWIGDTIAQYTTEQPRGYTIQRPFEQPTFVEPMPNGSYRINTPFQPPTVVQPMPNGGYRMDTPFQPPTFINPR